MIIKKPKPGEFRQRCPIDVSVTVEAEENHSVGKRFHGFGRGRICGCQRSGKGKNAVEAAFAKSGDTRLSLQKIEVRNPARTFLCRYQN